jgi:hypothetical protein
MVRKKEMHAHKDEAGGRAIRALPDHMERAQGGSSGANSPRLLLRQCPLAVRDFGDAALFQRLKGKGYGSIVDVSACRPDMIGDLGGRKGAMLAQDVGDRRADGRLCLRLVACLWLAFSLWPPRSPCLPRGKFFESQELTLGDAKIGELRLLFRDFCADALKRSVHDAYVYQDNEGLSPWLFVPAGSRRPPYRPGRRENHVAR